MNCIRIVGDRVLCRDSIPKSNSSSCIGAILAKNETKTCPVIKLTRKNEIIRLGSNYYYFFIIEPMKMAFTCYRNLTAEFTIIHSQIRGFDPNCVFRAEKFEFKTRKESVGKLEWIEAFKFGNMSITGFDKIKIKNMTVVLNLTKHTDMLMQITDKIENLDKKTTEEIEIKQTQFGLGAFFQSFSIFTNSISMLILTLIILICCCRCCAR